MHQPSRSLGARLIEDEEIDPARRATSTIESAEFRGEVRRRIYMVLQPKGSGSLVRSMIRGLPFRTSVAHAHESDGEKLIELRHRTQHGDACVEVRGEILDSPIEVPGDRWIVRCTDPQGAMFALVGKRSHNGIGYFERVPSRNRSSS